MNHHQRNAAERNDIRSTAFDRRYEPMYIVYDDGSSYLTILSLVMRENQICRKYDDISNYYLEISLPGGRTQLRCDSVAQRCFPVPAPILELNDSPGHELV